MHPSPLGDIVQWCWDAIPEHMPHVDIGDLVVMLNHVHGIVIIRERHTGRDPAGALMIGHDTDDRHSNSTNRERSTPYSLLRTRTV